MRAHRMIATHNGVRRGWTRLVAGLTSVLLLSAAFVGLGNLMGESTAQATNADSAGANTIGWGDSSARLSPNVFYAYVKAGETIRATASKYSAAGADSTFRLVDQAGTARAMSTLHTATVDGIWTFTASNPAGQTGDRYYNWNVDVRTGGVNKPGRVWSNEYKLNNLSGNTSPLLNYWAVNDVGYIYKIDLKNYNGINSIIQASATGNPVSQAQCAVPSYKSVSVTGIATACSSPYRLFFEPPANDLPVSAPSASGTLLVMPAPLSVSDLAVTALAFVPSAGLSAAGTFSWTMPSRFSGAYTLDIDTNGNGVYTDSVDRSIVMGANGSTLAASYVFDGLDGAGNAISNCQKLNARVHFDKLGEIHIRQEDVEGRGGITVNRLNGPNLPSSMLYWDDRSLPTTGVINQTPVIDGRAGVNSNTSAGVHGWGYGGNSWGDMRSMDDWTYASVDTTGAEIAVGGRCLTLTKTSSAPSHVRPGDTVTYTVTATNAGSVDYTAAIPARISDDLSDVLDDATYNDDATGGATVAGNVLTWSGPLAVGETKTISYTVTVNSPVTGDHRLGNTVIDPDGGGTCATAGGCTTDNPVQTYTVQKSSDTAVALPGATVTYSVTVVNTGQAPYTTAEPATFTDDLAAVLDDAGYNGDATLGATVSGSTLSWAGALAVGETKTITYSVTLDQPAEGDGVLTNVVLPDTSIGGSCDTTCSTTTILRTFETSKTVSTTSTVAGGGVTYTVTVTNTGAAEYTAGDPASFTDDLSAVLDDATYNGDASGGATVSGNTLTWSGALAVGETKTLTYSVTVNSPLTGDHRLTNTVVPDATAGGSCATAADCTTTTVVRAFTAAKTASAPSVVPGGTLIYTVTITNVGGAAYTTTDPAAFTDDLSAVLDDAEYNGDASNGATVTGNVLRWSGALAIGQTKTITYSVTANDPASGDRMLTNAVIPDDTAGGTCVAADDCVVSTPVRSFSVLKSTTATSVIAGDVVPFTITLTNTGAIDYTSAEPASFTDDLSNVLDDASYNGDADNGAVYSAPTLSWSGPLAVGESITISYSITVSDPIAGDAKLKNTVVTPDGSGGSCEAGSGNLDCVATVPGQSYTVSKTASSSTVNPGDDVVYTVIVTNTGAVDYTAGSPATFTDDLGSVLDDASYNEDATGGATVTGSTLAWSGALAVGASVTVTYSVTVNSPNSGDGVLTNAVVPTTRGGSCDPAEECETTTTVASYTVEKSADVTSTIPGGVVTYTVAIINTGQTDYTAGAPASFVDNLSEVLDDAAYNGDATGGATITGETLSWSGALAVGATVTITYSVTVDNPVTGDGILVNAVVPTGNGGSCATTGGCATTTPVRSFVVAKAASTDTVVAGGTIRYTLTVTNTGAADYTTGEPAALTDDLAAVLDDAVYNGDADNGATVAGNTLTWSGALAVGQSVTITYSVTVSAPATGDNVLTNVVGPDASVGGSCATDADCTTTALVRSYSVLKTASVPTAIGGDIVTYTVTVTNTGTAPYTSLSQAAFTDNLAAVLDDAVYNGDASNGATVNGTVLSWSGVLAVGASKSITYSVTVNAPSTGDHSLNNTVLTPPNTGGECGDCGTVTPVAAFTAVKSADTTTVTPGETVTYTVLLTNTGAVDYTAATPVSFTDDLSAVLDDAIYNDDADNGATYTAPTLAWSGALPIGGSITITYSLTINAPATGDGKLVNTVVTPPGIGGSCESGSTNSECTVSLPGPRLALTKTQSTDTAIAGGTVTYTVAVENVSEVDYTAASPAAFTDDLSAVLDDASYNGDADNGATVTGTELSWSGPLAAGAKQTITYSVTVDSPLTGDRVMTNVIATPPNVSSNCAVGSTDPDCTTTARIASFAVQKVADSTSVAPGDTVTYSVTVMNTGQVAYTVDDPATFVDDLSGVLDDATYNGDATTGATVTGTTLVWSGALATGASVVVTYSVTLATPASGDRMLVNVVIPDESAGGECLTEGGCTVTVPVSSYDVSKVVSIAQAKAGDVVRYTITVTNTGQVAFTDASPASFTDDLSAVLAGADYNADASSGATYSAPVLRWSGALAVGATEKVTYTVTVKQRTGAAELHNVVVVPANSGSQCVADSQDEDCAADTTIVTPPATLQSTGADISAPSVLAALLLALGVLMVAKVRRTRARTI